jgi:ferredoxin--NADP+ reductase
VLRFLVSPVAILGSERVEALEVERNELYQAEDGTLRPRATAERETLPVGLVFRAIGYQGVPLPGVPFDPWAGRIPNRGGRVVDPARGGEAVDGEYVVGWIKRGPQGIIGTNKPDSQETVEALLGDLAAGRLDREVPSRAVLEMLLHERKRDYVSYADWQLIDALERERGARAGAPRLKFSRVEEMLHALGERKEALREAEARAQAELSAGESRIA